MCRYKNPNPVRLGFFIIFNKNKFGALLISAYLCFKLLIMEENTVQETPKEPLKATHAAIPIEVFNDLVKRLSTLPWDTINPVMNALEKNTVYIAGVNPPPSQS